MKSFVKFLFMEMCIRDSITMDVPIGAVGVLLRPAVQKVRWRQGRTVPVSYTHLDVYKRQPT